MVNDEDGEEETTCRVIDADMPIKQRMGAGSKPDETAVLRAVGGCSAERLETLPTRQWRSRRPPGRTAQGPESKAARGWL